MHGNGMPLMVRIPLRGTCPAKRDPGQQMLCRLPRLLPSSYGPNLLLGFRLVWRTWYTNTMSASTSKTTRYVSPGNGV